MSLTYLSTKYKSKVYAVPRWSTGWAVIVTGTDLGMARIYDG